MSRFCLESLEERCVLSSTHITDFGADKTAAAIGDPLTLSTTAWGAAGVVAATYWLDLDNNHWWTPGVDRSLGDSWANPPFQSGVLRRTVVPDAGWPSQARIMTDARDTHGHWSGAPRELQLPVVDRPRADALTFAPPVAAPGESVRMSATVSSERPIRAVSFFVDMNENRRWDPGTDEPLGDVFTPAPGTTNRYDLTAIAGWEWGIGLGGPGQLQKYTRSIGAAVQTIDGVWGAAPVTADLTLAPRPVVNELRAHGNATSVQLTATIQTHTPGGWFVVLPGAPNAPYAVQFFYDANRNGVFDSGTDADLGQGAAGSNTVIINAATSASWAFPRQYGAYVLDSRLGADQRGPVRITDHQSAIGLERVRITTLSSIGPVTRQFPRDPFWVEGEMLRLRVGATPATGGAAVRTVSAFFDNNKNGKYDLGADQIIAELPGSSVEFLFPTRGEGMVSIGVFAKDWTWNPGYVKTWNVLVTKAPALTGLRAFPGQGQSGREVNVELDGATQSGIASVVAFIDLDNNGRPSAGDRSASTYHSVTGSSRQGHWALKVNAAGLSSGTYRVMLQVTNFYGAMTQTYVMVTI